MGFIRAPPLHNSFFKKTRPDSVFYTYSPCMDPHTKAAKRSPNRKKQSVTITLPPRLWEMATFLAAETFGNLSAYLAHLIATDLKDHGIDPMARIPSIDPAAPQPPVHPSKGNHDSKITDAPFQVKDPQIEKLRKIKKPKGK